jgi:RNA polymerase-binding transcription factor DksA
MKEPKHTTDNLTEIKTSHSALGLLMAECEQLRRDLDHTKFELEDTRELLSQHAWEVSPAMAQAKIDELNRELAKAKEQADLADRLAADNLKRVLMLEKELAQTKAESARLAAALGKYGCCFADCESYSQAETCTCGLRTAKQGTALREMLAPTIELLSRATSHNCGYTDWNPLWAEKELARLREITGGKP